MSSIKAQYIVVQLQQKSYFGLKLYYLAKLPSIQYCDNQFYIALTKNPNFHKCSKHIDIKYHILREKVESKFLELILIPSTRMSANILKNPYQNLNIMFVFQHKAFEIIVIPFLSIN